MEYFQPYKLFSDADIVAAWDSQVASPTGNATLQRLIAERGAQIFPEFAKRYRDIRAMPRSARRALQRRLAASHELANISAEGRRKLAYSIAGAALLLALSQAQAQAADIFVTTNVPGVNTSDGKCSLAEAIINANNNNQSGSPECDTGSGADVIHLPKGAQTLTSSYVDFHGATGLPVIDSHITIEGNGAKILRSSNAPNFRLLAVGANGLLTLKNATLSGGVANNGGAALIFGGHLYIENCTITGNTATNRGGGIYSYLGLLRIDPSVISKNKALRGGGLYSNRGNNYISETTITANQATGGEGGGIYAYRGYLYIETSTISKNTANYGGGIGVYDATVSVSSSTISGNKAVLRGGGVSVRYATFTIDSGSAITKNSANRGGGIATDFSEGSVTDATISGNKAVADGGGIFVYYGGGVFEVNHSTITKNSAGTSGGGIENYGGTVLLTNSSVITGNKAKLRGGGVANSTLSFLFMNEGGTSTVSGNSAPTGPDLFPSPGP